MQFIIEEPQIEHFLDSKPSKPHPTYSRSYGYGYGYGGYNGYGGYRTYGGYSGYGGYGGYRTYGGYSGYGGYRIYGGYVGYGGYNAYGGYRTYGGYGGYGYNGYEGVNNVPSMEEVDAPRDEYLDLLNNEQLLWLHQAFSGGMRNQEGMGWKLKENQRFTSDEGKAILFRAAKSSGDFQERIFRAVAHEAMHNPKVLNKLTLMP